jgi:hypothetical protein
MRGDVFSPDFGQATIIGIPRNVGRDPRIDLDRSILLLFPDFSDGRPALSK